MTAGERRTAWEVFRDAVDGMSPGQRQTAAIVLALACAVVGLGRPAAPARVAAAAESPVSRLLALPPAPELAAASPRMVGLGLPDLVPPALSSGSSGRSAAGPSSTRLRGTATAEPALQHRVRVANLVLPPSPTATGRDDASIAEAFLSRGGYSYTTVVDDGSATVCRRTTQAGTLVIAHADLAPALRTCLLAAGATVLGYDSTGSAPGGNSTGGRAFSERTSVYSTFLAAALWAKRSGTLAGPLGVVTALSVKPAVERAETALARLGMLVAKSAFLDTSDSSHSDVPANVLAMHEAGVSTVIFAVPQSLQQQWVTQATPLDPSIHYLVTDAFDGITQENYPASFQGAVGYTSVRAPWFYRDHPNDPHTGIAHECEAIWERATTVPVTEQGAETVDVLSRCEEAATLSAALRHAKDLPSVNRWLADTTLLSPLTSDLAALPDDTYGPTEFASVTWQARCSCWVQATDFRPATGSRRAD